MTDNLDGITPGDEPGADGAGPGDGTGDGAGDGGAPDPYRPDGLAEDYHGDSDTDTIDKLLAGFKEQKSRADGLREKLAGGVVPKEASEYPDITYSDGFLEKHGDPAPTDDPMTDILRTQALAAGISTEAYGKFIPAVLEAASEAGILEPPLSMDGEFEKAGGKEAYERAKTALDQRFDGLVSQEKLTEAQREELRVFQATADGQGALAAILDLSREKGVQTTGGNNHTGGDTKDVVRKDMRDPRYQEGAPEFDKDFRKQVDARAARVFGTRS